MDSVWDGTVRKYKDGCWVIRDDFFATDCRNRICILMQFLNKRFGILVNNQIENTVVIQCFINHFRKDSMAVVFPGMEVLRKRA